MKKHLKRLLVTLAIVGLTCATMLVVRGGKNDAHAEMVKKEIASQARRFERRAAELRGITPQRESTPYDISRLLEAAEFLKNRDHLEKPYLLLAYIRLEDRSKWSKEFEGKNMLMAISWLEDGFETLGIKAQFTQKGKQQTVKLPLYRHRWDEEARTWYNNTLERHPIHTVLIGDRFALEKISDDCCPNVIVPEGVIAMPIVISLYDEKGNESNAVELFVYEEVRAFILAQLKPETGG